MAFDLENAVQQGFNRDVTTNDFNVRAQNLEVVLGDAGGGTEFRVLDSDNVAVVVADSDGYLAIAGNAEVHGGHLLISNPYLGGPGTGTEYITLRDADGVVDDISILSVDGDPNGLITSTKGSLGLDHADGYLYINNDGSFGWTRLVGAGEIVAVTLQQAYNYDVDGGDATITTNAVDGSVVIAGTESLQVTADGGFNVNTAGAFTLDADTASSLNVNSANLTISTTTSGDITVTVPSGGTGNFIVNEGAGSNYIATNTADNELVLGDASPEIVVLVASDFTVEGDAVVQGDLTVNGTTTYVNTEDLYVEDRMMRLNVGAAPSFNGTTGIEAEVGSDGYVEFHWDDADSRWEISIDRSVAPEGQTFRPLPYLSAVPPTLDLSETGNDGWPTAGPNITGAAAINTNFTNFPYSFGDYMADDSVQSALEAIDAYFINIAGTINSVNYITLQQAYDNDSDGGDATIVTNATDGDVVIAGTEQFRVTAGGGVDIAVAGAVSIDSSAASNFTVDGANLTLSTTTSGDVIVSSAGDVDVDGTNVTLDATATISLDAGAASNFTTTAGALTLDGAGGIILDGNGSDVVPASNNTDTFGSPTNGWVDIYLNNANHGGAVVALSAIGGSIAHNSTAGADLVGTNSDNFAYTFGPTMVEDTVQAALEAIDGYLQYLSVGVSTPTTLQIAYDNDADGGNAIITTNTTDGSVVIAGTESLWVTATSGIDLDTGFDMDATAGESFDVNLTGGGGFSLDAYSANSNISVNGADLVVETTTSGILYLTGATGVVLDGTGDNVRPGADGTDTLGTSGFGWADIYLRNVPNTTTVALRGAGGASAPNTTSGAHAVGTNATNFNTFGADMTDNSVQAALEAIDGYLATFTLNDFDSVYTKKVGVDINGAILNGIINVVNTGLSFPATGTSRATWTFPVPADWDGMSDITVTAIWSPSNNNTGDVAWRLESRVLSLTELITSAATNDDYTQAGGGTADAIQSTVDNLSIAAGDILTTDAIIAISLVRRGDAAGDTFTGNAQVHLVQYSYSAQNIV